MTIQATTNSSAAIRAMVRTLSTGLGKPGLRTKRACSRHEIFVAIRAARTAKKRVRVYSPAGFVPSSYRGRCDIQYVEAVRSDDGGWQFRTGWTGAQRPHGAGSLLVVQ